MAKIPITLTGGSGITSDDVTASKAQVHPDGATVTTDSNDEVVSGTMTLRTAQEIVVAANDRTIHADQYLVGDQTILGVKTQNISTGNIKKDVVVRVGDSKQANRITGVTGTYLAPSDGDQTSGTIATAAQILSGYTAWANNAEIKGSIVSQAGGTKYATTSTQNNVVSAGRYLTSAINIGALGAGTNFSAANIKYGTRVYVNNGSTNVDILGTNGTYTQVSSGQTALVAGALRAGYSGFANGGNEVKGTIADQAGGTKYATTTAQNGVAAANRYLTSAINIGALSAGTNFNVANIKYGTKIYVNNGNTNIDILGTNGTGTFTSAGTVSSGQTAAAAAQIRSGYSAWVDGAEVKGSLAINSVVSFSAARTALNTIQITGRVPSTYVSVGSGRPWSGVYVRGKARTSADTANYPTSVTDGFEIGILSGTTPGGACVLNYTSATNMPTGSIIDVRGWDFAYYNTNGSSSSYPNRLYGSSHDAGGVLMHFDGEDNAVTESFNSTGVYTWTLPSGANRVQFFAVGGGGGSGAAKSRGYISYGTDADDNPTEDEITTDWGYSGGGGSGRVETSNVYSHASGTQYYFSVGAGGTGGTTGNGGSGASTTVRLTNSTGTVLATAAGGSGSVMASDVSGAGASGGSGGGGGGGAASVGQTEYGQGYGGIGGYNGGNGGDGYRASNGGTGQDSATGTMFQNVYYAGGGGGSGRQQSGRYGYAQYGGAIGGFGGGGLGGDANGIYGNTQSRTASIKYIMVTTTSTSTWNIPVIDEAQPTIGAHRQIWPDSVESVTLADLRNTWIKLILTNSYGAGTGAININVDNIGNKLLKIDGNITSASYTRPALPAGAYLVYFDGTYFELSTDEQSADVRRQGHSGAAGTGSGAGGSACKPWISEQTDYFIPGADGGCGCIVAKYWYQT